MFPKKAAHQEKVLFDKIKYLALVMTKKSLSKEYLSDEKIKELGILFLRFLVIHLWSSEKIKTGILPNLFLTILILCR